MGSPVQKDITEKMTELAEDGVELSVVSTAKQVTVEPKQLRGRFADDVTFVIFSKSARGVMNRDWTDYRNRHRVDSPAPLYTGPASLEQNKVETSIPTDTTEATDLGISKQQENPADVPAEEKVPIPVPVNVEDEELQLNWWEKIVAWVKKFIASLNRDSQSKQ